MDQLFLEKIVGGNATVLGTAFSQEMLLDDKLRIRAVGSTIEAWRRDNGTGLWTKRQVTDTTYSGGGYLGVGIRYPSTRLDDFGGGSAIQSLAPDALLNRYAPELRFHEDETYRADSPAIMTDNYVAEQYSNRLVDGLETVIAVADPADSADDLALTYLNSVYPTSQIASDEDRIDAVNSYALDAQRMHADPQYADRVFGRYLPLTDGGAILQYWMYYYNNPKTYLGFGAHEGDWELAQVRVESFGLPVEAAYSQHSGGERCAWVNVQRTSAGRPIVYVAEGSHANFFSSGYHLSTSDYTSDQGERLVPAMVSISTEPAWAQWPGRWGGSGTSPRFPKWQETWAWNDPLFWASQYGCTEEQTQFRLQSRPSSNARDALATPPTPRISAERTGASVVIRYFLPPVANRERKVWQLITTVSSSDRRYSPLTLRTRVTSTKGVIRRPLGLGKGPWRLRVTSVARNGMRSAPAERILR